MIADARHFIFRFTRKIIVMVAGLLLPSEPVLATTISLNGNFAGLGPEPMSPTLFINLGGTTMLRRLVQKSMTGNNCDV